VTRMSKADREREENEKKERLDCEFDDAIGRKLYKSELENKQFYADIAETNRQFEASEAKLYKRLEAEKRVAPAVRIANRRAFFPAGAEPGDRVFDPATNQFYEY
jgi:hypothetical protein